MNELNQSLPLSLVSHYVHVYTSKCLVRLSVGWTTMNSEYCQKCLLIFHLLGQNSLSLRANKLSKWLRHVPRTFYVLFSFGLIVRHCLIDEYTEKPAILVLYLILALAFAINGCVFLEYFIVPNGVQKLNFAYKDAIDYLEQKLYVQIAFDRFRRMFQCNVQIIFWTFLSTLIMKMVFFLSGDASHIEFMIIFFYYFKHFASMHILFHIEFVRFLMETVNMEIDSSQKQQELTIKSMHMQSRTSELLQTLHHVKCIHFRVWKIVRVLNIRFGWILTGLLLGTLLDITFSSYWLYVFLHDAVHQTVNEFMREY